MRPLKFTPPGLSPGALAGVYGFSTSTTAGSGQTIAIVDAFDDPTAASDLNAFSQQFGLPQCDATNPCFSKVNQTGGTSFPTANASWSLEISLDIEWVHAAAPGAHILLVEASDNSLTNLFAAEAYASAHAAYVSNSSGTPESPGETAADSTFSTPGVSYSRPQAIPGVLSSIRQLLRT